MSKGMYNVDYIDLSFFYLIDWEKYAALIVSHHIILFNNIIKNHSTLIKI